jgi:hypothetical protein
MSAICRLPRANEGSVLAHRHGTNLKKIHNDDMCLAQEQQLPVCEPFGGLGIDCMWIFILSLISSILILGNQKYMKYESMPVQLFNHSLGKLQQSCL